MNAYVMLGDPSFLRESIRAYYGHVDRIVVSFDQSATSWTGTPLPIEQCLRIVRDLDADDKVVEAPGLFSDHSADPLENDTHQRQVALDLAGRDADWVLQLDTDEVMGDPDVFFSALATADGAGRGGLDFPARWLYTRTAPGRYLELTDRWWRRAASYPGPLAVRAGTTLKLARQADIARWRVDLRSRNTDPWSPRDTRVDEVIEAQAAVFHFSWVRDPELMRRKFQWSGHADQLGEPRVYRDWVTHTRHPWWATVTNPLRSNNWLRPAAIPEPPGGLPITVEVD